MKEPKLPELIENIKNDSVELIVSSKVPSDWILERLINHAKRHYGLTLWEKDDSIVIEEKRKRPSNGFHWSYRELQVIALSLREYNAHLSGIERKLLRRAEK